MKKGEHPHVFLAPSLSSATSFLVPFKGFFLYRIPPIRFSCGGKVPPLALRSNVLPLPEDMIGIFIQEGDYTEFPPTFWSANLMAEKLYFIV